LRLERAAEAVETGWRYLAEAEAARIDVLAVHIKMPLAMALASHAEQAAGVQMARDVVEQLEACRAGWNSPTCSRRAYA